jgi:hypothetical protein
MLDIYLSFTDEAEANLVLYSINVTIDADNSVVEEEKIPKYQNIDVIGTVYQRPPEPTPEDYVPQPYPAPNYGVNIRLLDGEDIEPLKPYIIQPKNPVRIWA